MSQNATPTTFNKKLVFIVGAALLVVVVIAGLIFANLTRTQALDVQEPIAVPTEAVTDEPDIDEDAATSINTTGENVDEFTAIALAFAPWATATTNFTKEEVAQSVYIAYLFTKQLGTDPTLASGKWADEGFPEEDISLIYGNYFSDNYQSEVAGNITRFGEIFDPNSTSEEQVALYGNIAGLIPFNWAGANGCEVGENTATCVWAEDYPKYSDFTFAETESGTRLDVGFTVTYRMPATNTDGRAGFIEQVHTYNLNFERSDREVNPQNLDFPFYISGHQASGVSNGWVKGD